jgi:hypothetical protein
VWFKLNLRGKIIHCISQTNDAVNMFGYIDIFFLRTLVVRVGILRGG